MTDHNASEADELPLVSIVTAVRNGARFLPMLIDSVLEQDYPRIEHIVIDDGSDDDDATLSVLGRYPHLRWWTRDNRGQYATQNEGIAAAEGAIIGVICADDCYVTPGAVTTVVEAFRQRPDFGCVIGRVLDIGQDGMPAEWQVRLSGPWAARLLKYSSTISHCGIFVRRAALPETRQPFDPWFRYCGDWDWLLGLQRSGVLFGFVDEPIALYRVHDLQTTRACDVTRFRNETQRVLSRHGGSYTAWLTVRTALNCRSLVLKARFSLRVGGLRLLVRRLGEWFARRLRLLRN